MTDRLLRKKDIAAMLGTSEGVAASVLEKQGVHPIDLGYGRSRGLRWLESAVSAALQNMHSEAQSVSGPHPQRPPKAPRVPSATLASMSINELEAILTTGQGVQ